MKIKGIPVGTTIPRSDWGQTDPRKSDYIRNKPKAVLYTEQTLSDEQKTQARKNIGAAEDAELIDIRLGADGTVYPSAGEAVRRQVGKPQVGMKTEAGGEIFNDYDTNEASAQFATAFGSENKALGKASFARGLKKDRSGAPDIDSPDFKESDWRYNEAIGEASEANGMGAVAYSRASKSFGYRTQTGYPPSAEYAQARPEAVVMTDDNGQPVYPADNKAQAAVAIGSDTAALANNTLAGGWKTKASGDAAVSLGRETCADGPYSLSIGAFTKALGNWTIAGGYGTQSVNEGAISLGKNSVADGDYATALGAETRATGYSSVACGYKTKAINDNALAFGNSTEANGKRSIAGGENSKANGLRAFAFGYSAEANCEMSFAMGCFTVSQADCAYAFGYHTCTAKEYDDNGNKIAGKPGYGQMVIGTCNAYKNGEIDKALFVVGNGSSDNNRSNAFVVNADGSIVLGSGCYGDKLPDNPVDGQLFFLKV